MRSMKTDVAYGDVNWSTLKTLIPFLTEFKTRMGLALLCLVMAKLASVGLPFILKHIVDDLDQSSEVGTALAIPLGLLLAYGTVRFSNVLFGELRDTLFGRITERAMRRVGLKVFRHLHALDLDFHLNRRTGGLSRDIERGTNGIAFLLRFMVFNIVPTLLEIVMVIGLLVWNYSVWFGVIVALAVVAYVAYSVVATEWRTRFVRQANQAESQTSTRSVDSLLNYETVKYFTNEKHEAEHYDRELQDWEKARRMNRLSVFALNGGQSFVIAVSMTAAMVLAAHEVTNQRMTLGDFVLINAFMMQIFMPLNFLGFVYREMKGSMANIESMFGLLKVEPKVTDIADAPELQVREGAIEFEQVQFGYHTDRSILNGVSFSVPARHKVAVVGSSGAGKSTLAKMLFRFYDADKGRVLIDGQDVSQVTQHSLRGAIGVVPQDTVLFNTSIFENVRYGRVDASDEEVWEAIRLAHLADFIRQLPKGEETVVGERGLKLSGGEKQRVAIARTILKRPPIIVFDEATSSLDSHSEQSILKAIEEISREQTSLVIAHRLSTIVDADNIVVLDQGRVVEQGNHEALLARGGHYAHLWELQQQEPLLPEEV
ncbi:ABC transporter ATP-binding protein/permease [Pseudomaricurvus alkylphenolicus]|uniref:ABCB family ABC transporter ATP-binding protein/permease n=1 Tax=Pseudomaricurvus alkylphenolicus TaxID=1306991 RepID=UPI0014206AC0|nr:ABC transporter ATP-binding protein/permease [Pseudomaricurvus alkylphenolicus]NIB43967.1 ABC transporter ATP-binding protein/permease [Pseudomaricurvus alkylphenolicus]